MGFADVLGLFASARQICAARIDLERGRDGGRRSHVALLPHWLD
jgi:hypothetical protein